MVSKQERARVVIVDDHPLFRQGVRYTLESSGEFIVVARPPTGNTRCKWPKHWPPM